MQTPSAMDVFDHLRRELLHDLRWRQRLPVLGTAATDSLQNQQAQLAEIVQGLSADLQQRLQDPAFLTRFAAALRDRT